MSFVEVLILVGVITILLLGGLFIFYHFIYANYQREISNSSFTDLMTVLNVIVHTEIEIYEKNLFDTKGSLTPQNFENYYNDIVHNIINSLSDEFYRKMRQYISNDALIAYICRNVKEYLSDKVNGSI